MSARSCDQLGDMYTDHQGTDDQCALMICVAPAVPPVSINQCQLSGLIHATCQCHINATFQCPSELPFSVTHLCLSVPPINASKWCQSVLPISVHQCP
ncbi:unnamed protein product [Staurois parvus]|uniref:Uncharacterized protein n=1 Tax=Staurois parvus TaxID=386267 RepID=A0ABN9FG07_9NEOB|nr:unnamed protein product [Staurois parvus]